MFLLGVSLSKNLSFNNVKNVEIKGCKLIQMKIIK